MTVTWILDSGFDASAVGCTIWEQEEHVVWRIKHTDRLLAVQDRAGHWHDGAITQARQHLRRLGQAETMMVVQRGRQRRPKEQRVPVELWACPVRVRYATHVRRPGAGEEVDKQRWLVDVRIPDTTLEPWLLLTDGPVVDEPNAVRNCCRYRQRWAAEDSCTFTKDCLGGGGAGAGRGGGAHAGGTGLGGGGLAV